MNLISAKHAVATKQTTHSPPRLVRILSLRIRNSFEPCSIDEEISQVLHIPLSLIHMCKVRRIVKLDPFDLLNTLKERLDGGVLNFVMHSVDKQSRSLDLRKLADTTPITKRARETQLRGTLPTEQVSLVQQYQNERKSMGFTNTHMVP